MEGQILGGDEKLVSLLVSWFRIGELWFGLLSQEWKCHQGVNSLLSVGLQNHMTSLIIDSQVFRIFFVLN